MWYKSRSAIEPSVIDNASSQKYVYIRRNIQKVEIQDVLSGATEIFYSYEEQKIPKEVYEVFAQEKNNSSRLDDIEETVVEILGGEI